MIDMKTFKEIEMDAATKTRGRDIPRFPLITQYTRGLDGVWVIGGAPRIGKSTLARHIVYALAGPTTPVIYLDQESNHADKQTLDGIIACYDAGLRERLRKYFIQADSLLEVDQLVHTARTRQGDDDPEDVRAIVVLDHLQAIAEALKLDDAARAISRVMFMAGEWAKAGHLVVVLSQVNRRSYERQRPRLSDFMGSASIEQTAHVAVGVWSPTGNPSQDVVVTPLKTRFLQDRRVDIHLQRDGYAFTEDIVRVYNGGSVGAAKPVKLTKVQAAFRGREAETLATRDIIQSLGMLRRWDTAERYITSAVKKGEVYRAGKGQYTLTKPASVPAEVPAGVREEVRECGNL